MTQGSLSSCLFVGDFAVAAAKEFDETNSVTEGIGHVSDAAPIVRLDLSLDRGPGSECPADCGLDFRDHEIEVYWRPVSLIAAHFVGVC